MLVAEFPNKRAVTRQKYNQRWRHLNEDFVRCRGETRHPTRGVGFKERMPLTIVPDSSDRSCGSGRGATNRSLIVVILRTSQTGALSPENTIQSEGGLEEVKLEVGEAVASTGRRTVP
jgi:hypothetical protein